MAKYGANTAHPSAYRLVLGEVIEEAASQLGHATDKGDESGVRVAGAILSAALHTSRHVPEGAGRKVRGDMLVALGAFGLPMMAAELDYSAEGAIL